MSKKSKIPPYSSLSERLQDIKSSSKRIVSAVVLTYEFDSDLVELLVKTSLLDLNGAEDTECLRMQGSLPAVIFYHPKRDQKGALPNNVELHFWKGKQPGTCHHSKVYAFVFDDMSAELIIGSMNFTRSGLFQNREIFWDFEISGNNRTNVQVFRQWGDFVRNELIERAPESPTLNSYADVLTEILNSAVDEDKEAEEVLPCLIDSGYRTRSNGLARLSQYLKQTPMGEVSRLVIVSPFFDKAERKRQVIDRFLAEFDGIEQVTVFSNNWPNTFSDDREGLDVRRYLVPREIEDAERAILREYYDTEMEFDVGVRELHAKLLMLLDKDGNGVVYAGSANFSMNAWCGRNYELGVAAYVPMGLNTDIKILKYVQNLLGVCCNPVYARVEGAPEVEDPEDQDQTYFFPHALESVQLLGVQSEGQGLQGMFVLNVLEESLIEGEYSWEGLDLDFHWNDDSGRWESQHIDLKAIQECLGMSRWLTWSDDDDGAPIAIPFNVDASFSVASEFTYVVDSENILDYLTAIIKYGVKREVPRKRAPRQSSDTQKAKGSKEVSFVDRNDNTVVYIQQWLRSICELEATLFVGSEKLNPLIPVTDFPIYFSCMAKQLAKFKTISEDGRCFCLGELYTLANRFFSIAQKQFSIAGSSSHFNSSCEAVLEEIKTLFMASVKKAEPKTDAKVLSLYKQFVLGE